MAVMTTCLEGFPRSLKRGRYVIDSLPNLGFRDEGVDLALCSHLLFTYTDQLSIEFHVDAIVDACRVAREVRIFTLLKSCGGTSPHLEPVVKALQARGSRVEIRQIANEFQRGGHKLIYPYTRGKSPLQIGIGENPRFRRGQRKDAGTS